MARYVGKSIPRVDAVLKATGQAQFAADLSLPGMLYGKVLRSPYPHARILHIDTSRAERLIGVKAVVTADDTPKIRYGILPTTRDRYPLAVDKVRFVGEELAAVAAVDLDTAQEALDLIKVDYEILPAVFDPEEAMKPGAPQVHEDRPGNISAETHMEFGNVEEGFKEADYIREDVFRTQDVIHGFIEPHACVGYWDPTGKVTLWANKQSPYITYRHMARALDIPLSRMRIIQTYVGGGFGGKHDPFGLDFAAVLLSKKSGRPVKVVLDQEEVFFSGTRRHPMIIRLKTGIKKDGTLVASQCELIADGGAYAGIGPVTIYLGAAFSTLPLRIPNIKYDAYRVYTNKPCSGALRGHGIPQLRMAYESQIDMFAKDLGLDPVGIRLKNAVQAGEETGNGLKVRSCGLSESIKRVAEVTRFQERWGRPKGDGKKRIGVGLACNALCSGARLSSHNASTVVVKVHEDGGVTLMTGSTDVGQGCATVLAQILADELGIDINEIQVPNVDTEVTPIDPGVYGSRVTYTSGNAVRVAAAAIKKQLFAVAADLLQVSPDDLAIGDHIIYVKQNPTKCVDFKKVVRTAYYVKNEPVIGHGSFTPGTETPDFATGRGNLSTEYSFGTQFAEVEVDTETGKIKVNRMVLAHDCGMPINPQMVEGQLEGAVASGLAQVLFEELPRDHGLILTPNFLDYGMPTAKDVPLDFQFIDVITSDPENPVFKEAGEGTQISTLAAIVNAIADALGTHIKELPITPEKVLEVLKQQKEGGQRRDA